ncbi:MAG: hypothetical protein RLZZ535_3127 [Cyanobacteriota bacterium]|jgi:transcriptional regulator with XRE-family HTH domain
MNSKPRESSIQLTSEGIGKVREKERELKKKNQNGKRITQEDIAKKAHTSIDTFKRFLGGKIYTSEPSFDAIIQALELKIGTDLIEDIDFTRGKSLSNSESTLIASSHENLEKNRSMLTDLEKQDLVEEIKRYYVGKEDSLKNIFLMNQEIFGTNFYGETRGESFNIRISNLREELILRNKLNDFIRIVRQDYPNFAISLLVVLILIEYAKYPGVC